MYVIVFNKFLTFLFTCLEIYFAFVTETHLGNLEISVYFCCIILFPPNIVSTPGRSERPTSVTLSTEWLGS